MSRRKQRKHSAEFKFKLVLEALRGERTHTEIAREHDITKSLLYTLRSRICKVETKIANWVNDTRTRCN